MSIGNQIDVDRVDSGMGAGADVVVLGQIGRDIALWVDEVPEAGSTAAVRQRIEAPGGRGANQAVALAQLGRAPALVGVVGHDGPGEAVLAQAAADGIDTRAVVRRDGVRTGLVVDVVDSTGGRRHLEDLPPGVLLTAADVHAAAPVFAGARVVVVHLRQPLPAVVAAADHAARARAVVVLDGAPPRPSAVDALLARADVLRAGDAAAALWAGAEIGSADDAVRVARSLVRRGPRMVVLGAGSAGNVVAWADGHAVVPLGVVEVVDTAGAGAAFTAGIVAALHRGPEAALRWGSAAAALTVGHVGRRPRLTPDAVARAATRGG